MPLYEFVCDNCTLTSERFTPSRHDPHVCDECGKPLRFVLTAPAIRGTTVSRP